MYATMEADIRKGRVVPLEPKRVPKSGRALLIILSQSESVQKSQWKAVRARLGWLQPSVDPVKWQRQIRDEWNGRA